MSEAQNVVASSASKIPAESVAPKTYIQPPVDIYEDADGITLLADLPGVAKEGLNIQVDKDTLLIEGEASFDLPENIQPLYADIRTTRYRRSFALSGELDTAHIEASLRDGVLNLRIPKRPESKPRRIEVVSA